MTHTEQLGLPTPASAEDVIDTQSIAGMRRAILKGAHSSSLIRECFDKAQSRLLGREEIYVLLAYEALLRLETLHQTLNGPGRARLQEVVTVRDVDGHV